MQVLRLGGEALMTTDLTGLAVARARSFPRGHAGGSGELGERLEARASSSILPMGDEVGGAALLAMARPARRHRR